MCQLLGMNCNIPTDICFSFSGFHQRGGRTDEHVDGWGIAFYEGVGCRVYLDTKPAAESPVATMVRDYPIRSLNVIAHIRKATVSSVALENTHPFVRELWGRYWTFAHNGTLSNLDCAPEDSNRRYSPVGRTDSEYAFCYLLEMLHRRFPAGEPDEAALYKAMVGITTELCTYGTFNFLLSNGNLLFAHCATKLAYVVREAPFAEAHLVDEDYSVDFRSVTTPQDRVAIIATVPLTDNEPWRTMRASELLLFRNGQPLEY
ncbi:MAG: class II glutamine amidotransferase [Gammaproteobacteria bacterium]|nr:class II glutamine amidotransferase [Gammaproteobacteria bacterium]